MSKKQAYPNRIPFESIETLDKWPLPSLGETPAPDRRTQPPGGRRANERVEDVDGPVQHRPLTADQLNQITEEAEKAGYQSGYEKGLQEGRQAGEKQGAEEGRQQAEREHGEVLMADIERFRKLSNALMEPLEQQDREVESLVVEMAVELARHLLQVELKTDPSALYAVVERALDAVPMGASNVRIFLNPDDLQVVDKLFAESDRDWRFAADKTLSRGGCRVESAQSTIDFSVERRLREYLSAVADGGDTDHLSAQPVDDYRQTNASDDVQPRDGGEHDNDE